MYFICGRKKRQIEEVWKHSAEEEGHKDTKSGGN
jgi:hypothetical protein